MFQFGNGHRWLPDEVRKSGAWGARLAVSITWLRLAAVTVRFAALPVMLRLDAPHRLGARAHHDRIGGRAVAEEVDALHQLTVGHAAGREEHVVGPDQVVAGEHALEVSFGQASLNGVPLFLLGARPQLALHLAPQALSRGRG